MSAARTVSLEKATADMVGAWGPPPRLGWTAAVNAEGKVVMVAGKGALHVLEMNASAQGYTLAKIVAVSK